jgi:hypothetical protein
VEYLVPDTLHLDRDNIGVIAVLDDLGPQQPPEAAGGAKAGGEGRCRRRRRVVVVANTHLLFNPRRGDVKLAQVEMLLRRLEVCGCDDVLGVDVCVCVFVWKRKMGGEGAAGGGV